MAPVRQIRRERIWTRAQGRGPGGRRQPAAGVRHRDVPHNPLGDAVADMLFISSGLQNFSTGKAHRLRISPHSDLARYRQPLVDGYQYIRFEIGDTGYVFNQQ
jgi:hypothetical protein